MPTPAFKPTPFEPIAVEPVTLEQTPEPMPAPMSTQIPAQRPTQISAPTPERRAPHVQTRSVVPEAEQALRAAGLHPVEARLYAARGIAGPDGLDTGMARLLPFDSLKGIHAAACRLADAIARQEKLLIVADYDADGATACALGVRGLRLLGATVDFIVPNRFEYGYGLTPEIVDLAARQGPQLIITVDNGISSAPGVERARQLGIEVLVTDHHLPGDTLPDALIVNPNQPGCTFPSKCLAGVGVMFYVLLALRAELRQRGQFADGNGAEGKGPNLADLLDLVALGTVADMVRLDANNRVLVEQGLRRMRAGRAQAGVLALFAAAGSDIRRAHAGDLGFRIGPRLNAAGRLDDMSLGIACLITEDAATAQRMAGELDSLNRERRSIEGEMQRIASEKLDAVDATDHFSLTVFDADFHQGVIGLVASRLKDRHHRPTMVFAACADGTLKGSGRSITGLHLRDAIDLIAKRHTDLILRFGGHAGAAGLTMRGDGLEIFRLSFEQVCRAAMSEADLRHCIEVDGELDPAALQLDLAERLNAQVWGQGFPEPRFCGRFRVVSQRVVGQKHLKLVLRAGPHDIEAMRFQHADPLARDIDAVYQLSVNEWQGERRLQLLLDYCTPAT